MPSGAATLVLAMVPMVAADGWGRSVVYNIVGGAFVLILPFTSDIEGGLNRVNFSLMGERHGGRWNVGEDIESAIVVGT